jgi:hypothetical protein
MAPLCIRTVLSGSSAMREQESSRRGKGATPGSVVQSGSQKTKRPRLGGCGKLNPCRGVCDPTDQRNSFDQDHVCDLAAAPTSPVMVAR